METKNVVLNEYWTHDGVAPNAKPGAYRASGENPETKWKGYGWTRPSDQTNTEAWVKGAESGAGRVCAIFPGISEKKNLLKPPLKYLHDNTVEYPANWVMLNPGNEFMCVYNPEMKLMMTWDPKAVEDDKMQSVKLKLYF